jgi:chromosome segregation ATPase
MERKNDKYNLDTCNHSKPESNYSNNYINELQRLNEKEKDALKYKIDSLQNYIEKIKVNFQNELKAAEDKANQYLNEKILLEQKISQLIEGTIKEKNLKINIITKENETLKEKIKILEEQIKDKNFQIRKKEEEYNNYIDNLKEEITTTRNDNTNLQKCHMAKVSEMIRNNDDNLKNIQEMHKKEIYDIYFDSKTKNDKLIQQVQDDYNTIEMLKNNNNNLQELVQKLENNNHILLHENKELKNKNTALSNNLKSSYNVNENLKKNMEKIKTENNNMKSDFDYFEDTINGLKNEIILMNETYAKKDKDFNYLLSQSEKIRKEFSNNMFDNEELDSKNRELIKENEELKKALLSFQETINF